ncbi:MAG: anhydro-N-acetylmuramic acid kinase, partial [Fimbriimonadales bacterium]
MTPDIATRFPENGWIAEWLTQLAQKPHRYAIGLMSGTSMDGVDGALVRLSGKGSARQVETLATHHLPYTSDERTALDRLLRQPDLETLVAWDAYLGERFAECAQALIQQAPEVDFIGSHGQTLWHAPSATVQGRSV